MKFDILTFLEKYKVLTAITGTEIGAIWLCAIITIFVFVLSFAAVGIIFRFIGFKGNSKPMSGVFAIISGILTSTFYCFLEKFQKPISFVCRNWKIAVIISLLLLLLPILIDIIDSLIYIIDEKKQNNKK